MTTKFKGWFHAALSVAAIAELLSSKSKVRRALLGGCAGYHLHAAMYHFFLEPNEDKNNKDLYSCIGYPSCDGDLLGEPHMAPCPLSPKESFIDKDGAPYSSSVFFVNKDGVHTYPTKPLTFQVEELNNYPCTAAEEVAKKKRKKRTKNV